MPVDLSRRAFLHQAGRGGIVVACAAIALPADLSALPITYMDGAGAATERRYPIPATDSVTIDRQVAVILVRYQGHVFALRLGCPHQNAAVKWVDKDGRFQCTKHDSKYQPDGTYVSGKSTRNLDRFGIRRDGEAVLVDLARVIQADKDAAGWQGMVVTL